MFFFNYFSTTHLHGWRWVFPAPDADLCFFDVEMGNISTQVFKSDVVENRKKQRLDSKIPFSKTRCSPDFKTHHCIVSTPLCYLQLLAVSLRWLLAG